MGVASLALTPDLGNDFMAPSPLLASSIVLCFVPDRVKGQMGQRLEAETPTKYSINKVGHHTLGAQKQKCNMRYLVVFFQIQIFNIQHFDSQAVFIRV